MECDNHGLLCSGCMVLEHQFLPLHRIQVQYIKVFR